MNCVEKGIIIEQIAEAFMKEIFIEDVERTEGLTEELNQDVLSFMALKELEGIDEEEVREKAVEYARKCEGLETIPYIDEMLQKYFFCKFDGVVEVYDNEGTYNPYYPKWYKKLGQLYYISCLTIGVIEHLMRRSLQEGNDLILEVIESMQD